MTAINGPDDLAALYDAYAAELHGYLARRVGTDIADDLVADAFLAAWQQRHSFDPSRASFRTWLYAVGTNLMRNHVRAEERRLRAWAKSHARALPVVGLDTSVVDAVDAYVLAGHLAKELAALRPEERDVLLMVAWAGLPVGEIAAALQIEPATARTRLHRARARLRASVDSQRAGRAKAAKGCGDA